MVQLTANNTFQPCITKCVSRFPFFQPLLTVRESRQGTSSRVSKALAIRNKRFALHHKAITTIENKVKSLHQLLRTLLFCFSSKIRLRDWNTKKRSEDGTNSFVMESSYKKQQIVCVGTLLQRVESRAGQTRERKLNTSEKIKHTVSSYLENVHNYCQTTSLLLGNK